MQLRCKATLMQCVCLCSYDMTLSDACASLADSWTQCDDSKLMQFQPSDLDQFSAYQKKAFLGLLLQHVISFASAACYSVILLISDFVLLLPVY